MKKLKKAIVIACALAIPLFVFAQEEEDVENKPVGEEIVTPESETEVERQEATAEPEQIQEQAEEVESEPEQEAAVESEPEQEAAEPEPEQEAAEPEPEQEAAEPEQEQEVAAEPEPEQEVAEPEQNQESGEPPASEFEEPANIYMSSTGKLYIKSKEPIYLRLSTSHEEGSQSFLLRNQQSLDASRPVQPFFFEGHGQHTVKHMADHRIPQRDANLHTFHIFDDGKAPRIKVSVSKAPWVYNGNVNIYGKPIRITLNITDQDSGVHAGFYALNTESFSVYGPPLSLEQEMDYTLQYNAIDNVSNRSKTRTRYYALDFTPPTTQYRLVGKHIMVDGGEVLSPKAKIGLKARDAKAGVKQIKFRFKGRRGTYGKRLLNMTGLKDGYQKLIYAAVDRVENAENNNTFDFYLDRIPPVAKSELLGDQYRRGKKQYVSGRTTVELTATDNKAGVNRIRYYRKSQRSMVYSSPFGFPQRNGPHSFTFNASDKVINISKRIARNVIVDISPPTVKVKFLGKHYYSRMTHYIRTSTKIKLPTTDNLSGVQSVTYTLDQNPDVSDRQAFTIQDEGPHTLVYHALDNVNNQSKDKTINIYVDETAPDIFPHFSVNPTIPDQQVFPLKSLLYLAATDKQAGVRTIYYSLNNGKELLYTKPLSFKKRKSYTIRIRAIDNVANESTSEVDFEIQ